ARTPPAGARRASPADFMTVRRVGFTLILLTRVESSHRRGYPANYVAISGRRYPAPTDRPATTRYQARKQRSAATVLFFRGRGASARLAGPFASYSKTYWPHVELPSRADIGMGTAISKDFLNQRPQNARANITSTCTRAQSSVANPQSAPSKARNKSVPPRIIASAPRAT